jgi:hypothetical protein
MKNLDTKQKRNKKTGWCKEVNGTEHFLSVGVSWMWFVLVNFGSVCQSIDIHKET